MVKLLVVEVVAGGTGGLAIKVRLENKPSAVFTRRRPRAAATPRRPSSSSRIRPADRQWFCPWCSTRAAKETFRRHRCRTRAGGRVSRRTGLIGAIERRGRCVRAGSLNRADRRGYRLQRDGAVAQIGGAIRAVPVRRIIVPNTEVRAPDDFQIIRQTRMTDGKIMGGQIRAVREPIEERHVRIADDLTIGMIFHHDQEHVIEMRDAVRYGTFGGRRARWPGRRPPIPREPLWIAR